MTLAPSCVILIGISLASPALADGQTAEAEQLFREGRRALKAGEIAKACKMFEASERLEPESGTEINLADCQEQNGQTASAWAMFVKAAESAKRGTSPLDTQRAAEAKRRAHALESKLVYLTIEVPENHALEGLKVVRNDSPVDPGTWNQPIPVDPGEYQISAEAPGRKPWSESIVVDAKDKSVEVPKLRRKPAPPPQPPDKTADQVTPPPPPPKHPTVPRRFTALAVTLAVFGFASTATATGLGLYSRSIEAQSDKLCPMTACDNPQANTDNRYARFDGWIANIGWGVGGLAIAGAVTAWWLGRPSRDDAVSVVPLVSGDGAGLALGGRF